MDYGTITTIISVFITYLLMMYYCDTTMQFKCNRLKSHCILTIGYFLYGSVCVLRLPVLNIACGLATNFFVIHLGYKSSIGKTIARTIILIAIAMFSELIASLIFNTKIDNELPTNISMLEDIIFVVISKLIQFVFFVIFKHISVDKNNMHRTPEMLWIIILPIASCAFMSLFNQIAGAVNKELKVYCVIISIMLLVSNLVVYVVCEHIVEKNIKIQQLQQIQQKQEMDFKSYQMLKEKYNDLKIMVHDFNKYCNSIEAILNSDQSEALHLVQRLRNENKEFMLVEYTNNSALNILLTQKTKKCNELGIDFQMYAKDTDLSFIDEFDVVAIFANLLDNAIESCINSEKKKIFFSIKLMNNSYIVFSIDNSADIKPMVINNHLLSRKKDKENHGIGMLSVQKALVKYDGNIQWTYNDKEHLFNTTVLLQPPN